MKNLIIYKSHWELIEQLSVEQVGYLMKGIAKFSKGEEVTFTDSMLIGIWLVMKRDFVIQTENYEKKKEANRKNGLKGGRPKTQQNPLGYLETEETHNNPQNLKDKDKDKEKDKEKDKDIVNSTGSILENKLKRQENLSEYLDEFFNN